MMRDFGSIKRGAAPSRTFPEARSPLQTGMLAALSAGRYDVLVFTVDVLFVMIVYIS